MGAATTGVQPPKRPGARAAILQAAAEVLARNPGAILEEVAKAAGVGRATLHRHFPSRADLLRAVALEALDHVEAALRSASFDRKDPAKDLRALVNALVPWGERLHFLLVASELFEDPELKKAEGRIDRHVVPVLRHAREKGFFRSDVPEAWLFAALEALLYASWAAVARGLLARQDAPRLLYDTLVDGFGVQSGQHR